jgi:3-ketosteroid 9alpha-monooxygenase subunit A
MTERLPLPMPFGWFRVADSDELAPGQVRGVRYAGEELVVYRGENGQAVVLDAFCPHLGAHLGHGGRVVGNSIRCPFHAWRFDGSGRCVEVPYARRIPPNARIATRPVCERNGMIFFWWHPQAAPPSWEIPEVPELGSDEWLPPTRHQHRIRSHPQEMAENTVDPVHFQVVHGVPELPPMDVTLEGHVFRGFQGLTFTTPKGEIEGRVDIENHGGSFGITRFQGVVETLLVISGAPIEDGLYETTIHFSVRKPHGNADAARAVGAAFIAEVNRQFTEDIPIWENKVYLERPLLCDGDGPIGQVRSYFQQFYAEGPYPSQAPLDEAD